MLVGDAVISAFFLFGYSLFRPDTPHLVIFLALLAGGFFRSLQMTSINTLSYADVPPAMLSRATSLTSMAQQLSQTVGVATGALFLQLMLAWRGGTALIAADFYPAFVGVAIISLLSVPFFCGWRPMRAPRSAAARRHDDISALLRRIALVRRGELGILRPDLGDRRPCAAPVDITHDHGQLGHELEHRGPGERAAPQHVCGGKPLSEQIGPASRAGRSACCSIVS